MKLRRKSIDYIIKNFPTAKKDHKIKCKIWDTILGNFLVKCKIY